MPNLIDLLMVEQINHKQIEEYLRALNLPPNVPDKLTEEWNLKSHSSQSVFEIVRQKNDLKLFQTLLDFDFPIPHEFNKDGLSEEVISLLTSRGQWQKEIQTGEGGILFNRTAALVEMALAEINVTADNAILIMGETGAGKSTLTNFMHGIDYKKSGPKITKSKPDDIEIAKVGRTSSSETIFPLGYKIKTLNSDALWVDMPGTQDTTGHMREIAAAVGTKALTKQVKKIKGIFLVCPWSKIEDSRLLGYRPIAEKIGRMLTKESPSSISALEKHVALVISKPIEGLAAEHVTEQLQMFWDNELAQLKDDMPQVDHNYQAKLAIKRVTKIFLDDPSKIIITDVTKLEAREEIKKAVSALPVAVEHSAFNFGSYHTCVERFKNKIDYFNDQYRTLCDNIEKTQSVLKEQEVQIITVQERLEEHERSYQDWMSKKIKVFRGADIEERIKENSQTVVRLREEIVGAKDRMASLTKQKDQLVVKIENIRCKIDIIKEIVCEPVIGLQNIKQSVQHKDKELLELYLKTLTLYENTLAMIARLKEEKQNQLKLCEQQGQLLREEKIEIEAIKELTGEGIDQHIQQQEAFVLAANKELEALRIDYKAQEKILAGYMRINDVNKTFFLKIRALATNLHGESAIHTSDYKIGELPTFYHTYNPRAERSLKSKLDMPSLTYQQSMSL